MNCISLLPNCFRCWIKGLRQRIPAQVHRIHPYNPIYFVLSPPAGNRRGKQSNMRICLRHGCGMAGIPQGTEIAAPWGMLFGSGKCIKRPAGGTVLCQPSSSAGSFVVSRISPLETNQQRNTFTNSRTRRNGCKMTIRLVGNAFMHSETHHNQKRQIE